MKYMGSKARFANEILPIILEGRKAEQWYVEPFAGGMNMIDKVKGNRIANDNNRYLIALWEGLQENKNRSVEISKEYYIDVRNCFNGKNSKYDDFTIGWVGFMGSANGRFFEGGYSGNSITKIGTVRAYIAESIRNIEKQAPNLKDVNFKFGDYRQLEIPKDSLLYCDIPYQGTKQYATSKGFDYNQFWDWVRGTILKGHKVFVSEYNAPVDFECVWQKEAKSSLSANSKSGGSKLSVEKLFRYKYQNL